MFGLLERIRAWLHEKPVASAPFVTMRGRVGAIADGANPLARKARPKGSIAARVYRVSTDKWEDLGVISRPGKE